MKIYLVIDNGYSGSFEDKVRYVTGNKQDCIDFVDSHPKQDCWTPYIVDTSAKSLHIKRIHSHRSSRKIIERR